VSLKKTYSAIRVLRNKYVSNPKDKLKSPHIILNNTIVTLKIRNSLPLIVDTKMSTFKLLVIKVPIEF
jgi:hypothetical protein